MGQNGSVYRQDVVAHNQQSGVLARSQRGRQERLSHGGHGLFLHHVLHSGKRTTVFTVKLYFLFQLKKNVTRLP